MKEAWAELKERLIQERGPQCERCRKKNATDLHHALVSRMKRKPELNVEENAELLCKKCHTCPGGYKERVMFWKRQGKRYGYDHMRDWYDSLDLKIKEIFK